MHAEHTVKKDETKMKVKIDSKPIKNTQFALFMETKSIQKKQKKKEEDEEEDKDGYFDN